MLRNARRLHPDKNLSTLTLLAIFGTDNPSLINAIPREEFIDRVNAKKQDLGITPKPTNPRVKRQAEKRVRQDMSPEQRKAPRRRPNHPRSTNPSHVARSASQAEPPPPPSASDEEEESSEDDDDDDYACTRAEVNQFASMA